MRSELVYEIAVVVDVEIAVVVLRFRIVVDCIALHVENQIETALH